MPKGSNIYFRGESRIAFNWLNIFWIFFLLKPTAAYSQSSNEIIISVNVKQIGYIEMPALIINETVYLPVNLIFDFIKIKNTLSPEHDLNEGFFINAKAAFSIDKKKNRIVYQNKIFPLRESDLIQTESNLYLKTNYFDEVFGLQCAYSFKDLAITISTTQELPAITEMRQQQMRRNLNKLKGEIKADTNIKRSSARFHLGMADWAIIGAQEANAKSNINVNLDIGGVIAGGETNFFVKYNTNLPFQFKDQFYRWKYVNNDNSVLRQVTLGSIFAQSTSTINAPITGLQITNTPNVFRRSYGTYTLSDKTESGNVVELYINNVLVDYTTADASGFYTFEIPLVYGNSVVTVRFYEVTGGVTSREQQITIPFNFIPLHQLEYSLTAGITADNNKSRFVRGVANYGLTKSITVGTGVEYLSSVESGKIMPFISASVQVNSNLLISGEHSYGIRSKAIINYRLPLNLQMDVTYIKYEKGQTAVKNSYLKEKKAVLSMPLRNKYLKGLSRITVNQFVHSGYKNTQAEFLLSGVINGVSSNFTTYTQFSTFKKTTTHHGVYSNLSLSFRLPKSLRITPQIKYNYNEQKLSMIKCEVEKKFIANGYMNFSYEKNMADNKHNITMALRYNFSFAQTTLSVRQNDNKIATTVSARGSLLFDETTGHLGTSNQSNIGKGGITLLAFLDLNCNGRREPNEPKIPGLNFKINGGYAKINKRDTTITISGLTAYTNYLIEIDNTFDNIAWQITRKKIGVYIGPNYHTLLQVPIAVLGEVSGKVFTKGNKLVKESERLKIKFYNTRAQLIGETVTEADGTFSYLGLAPGKYSARFDLDQLKRLQLRSTPGKHFTILSNPEGDVVNGLNFILQSL